MYAGLYFYKDYPRDPLQRYGCKDGCQSKRNSFFRIDSTSYPQVSEKDISRSLIYKVKNVRSTSETRIRRNKTKPNHKKQTYKNVGNFSIFGKHQVLSIFLPMYPGLNRISDSKRLGTKICWYFYLSRSKHTSDNFRLGVTELDGSKREEEYLYLSHILTRFIYITEVYENKGI